MMGNGRAEGQNKQWNESLQRQKVPILKHLCLFLHPFFIATRGGLFVLVWLNQEFSARPPKEGGKYSWFFKCEYYIFFFKKEPLRFSV